MLSRQRVFPQPAKEEFAEIHEAVMATSPNFYNVSRPVALKTDTRSRVIYGLEARRPQTSGCLAACFHDVSLGSRTARFFRKHAQGPEVRCRIRHSVFGTVDEPLADRSTVAALNAAKHSPDWPPAASP